MKRTLIAAVLIALVPMAGAIVDHNGSGTGDAHITGGGSSAGASAGVSEGSNGGTVEWRAEVEQTGSSCLSGNATAVADVNRTTVEDPNDASADGWRSISFHGTLQAPTPCHVMGHEVRQSEDGYVLELETPPSGSDTCVECVGGIGYEASFSAEGPYTLTVTYRNETLRTLDSEGEGDRWTGIAQLDTVIAALAGLLPL